MEKQTRKMNTIITTCLLKQVRKGLKEYLGKEEYKELMNHFWVYRYGDGSTEVHVNKCELFPEGYFQTLNSTDNMFHAKAEGMSHILKILKKADGRTINKSKI